MEICADIDLKSCNDCNMKVLTIKQPWAALIIDGQKDIENRSWATKVRGRVLIHAGKFVDLEGVEFARARGVLIPKLLLGGIIDSVEIFDCVIVSPSPWFFGSVGFALREPSALPFYKIRGMLGFWNFDETLLKACQPIQKEILSPEFEF